MRYLALVTCILFSFSLAAQRYVLFNPTCSERLHYDVINGNPDDSYIVYGISINANERIFLAVGEEGKKYEENIRGAVITCNTPSINRNLVDQVNNNLGPQYNMVRKDKQGRLVVSPIISASYLRYSKNDLEFHAPQYAFQYNFLSNKSSSQNLSARPSGARVFFTGNTNYGCRQGFMFNIVPRNANEIGSDITIVPEVGIVENRQNTNQNNLELAGVNTKSFRDHLSIICGTSGTKNAPIATRPPVNNVGTSSGNRDMSTNRSDNVFSPAQPPTNQPSNTRPTRQTSTPQPTYSPYSEGYTASRNELPAVSNTTTNTDYGMIAPYNNQQQARFTGQQQQQPPRQQQQPVANYGTQQTQPYSTAAPLPVNNTLPSQPIEGTHTVRSKETLYGIAKRYGLKVPELKSMNKLNANMIYPGQQLVVAQTGAFHTRGTDYNQPTRPATNTRPVPPTSTQTPDAWRTTTGYHTVQQGETIETIAQLYGYTPMRFRDLNGYSLTSVVFPGDRLKTTDCSAKEQPMQWRNNNDDPADLTNKGENDYYPSTTTFSTPAPYDSDYDILPTSFNTTLFSDTRTARTHVVRENETLYGIAKLYNTTVERLREVNKLDYTEVLLPNQRIMIR